MGLEIRVARNASGQQRIARYACGGQDIAEGFGQQSRQIITVMKVNEEECAASDAFILQRRHSSVLRRGWCIQSTEAK